MCYQLTSRHIDRPNSDKFIFYLKNNHKIAVTSAKIALKYLKIAEIPLKLYLIIILYHANNCLLAAI